MKIDRRGFLGFGLAAAAVAVAPKFALAAASLADTRFLLVFLRGGLDGLHALQPVGDPAFAALRGEFVRRQGQKPAHALNADFALHGALGFAAGLYASQTFLPVVAVAPPYRQRSHFEAQDCVENGTGTGTSGSGGSGWMNRCVAAMPGAKGLALSAVMPLALRGSGDATTWSPPLPEGVDPILWQQLQRLYSGDPVLGTTFAQIDPALAGGGMEAGQRGGMRLPQAMAAAGKFMSQATGPRIGFVEDTGWDTHGNELGVLDRKLAELDAGLQAIHDGAQPIWRNSVVAVVSEFGRTAAINGTGGSDHGTGGVAFLAGGAVNGGRVAGDWPGLALAQLNEGRDLRATTDLRALFKGVLRDHLGVGRDVLASRVFPDSATLAPMAGLVRAA